MFCDIERAGVSVFEAAALFVSAARSYEQGRNRRGCVAKQEAIEVEGVVTEVLPDQKFRVKLQNDHVVLAYAAGRMSKFRIRVLVGDRVTVELSPYDLDRGRITYRHKAGTSSGPPPGGGGRRRR